MIICAVYMLYVVGMANGVACLDNIMYVVRESSTIRLYNMDTLSPLDVVINVTGMKRPFDIVVCRHDRQLYVAESDCIWRVSVDDHSHVKWLTTQSSTDRFHVYSLSLTSRRLLVTSCYPFRPSTLRQYNTVDSQLCHIPLPQYVRGLSHAVETTRQTFVVGHWGTSQDKWQYAVSELLSVTAVNAFRLSNYICVVGLIIYQTICMHWRT